MIAAYPDIQASNYMINQYDLLLPGIYDPEMVLLLKDKVNNKDPVGWSGLIFAIVRQAKIDAMRGDQAAIDWLSCDVCQEYCFALGFEHSNILNWLKYKMEKVEAV